MSQFRREFLPARPGAGRPGGWASRRGRCPPSSRAGDQADAPAGVERAVGSSRRSGIPRVREPPARRFIQGARRIPPHRPAVFRGAGTRRRGGQRRQSCAGSRARSGRTRGAGHRRHAGRGAAAQGGGHEVLRRRRGTARRCRRGRDGDGKGPGSGDRLDLDPSLRSSGRHRRPGHGRARDRRAVPASAYRRVPVGGGGLAAGIAVAAAGCSPMRS